MLQVKFQPPCLSAVIDRPRLMRKLGSHETAPCLWLAGPPGSGKTTLALQFLQQQKKFYWWWRLDDDAATPADFFNDLRNLASTAEPPIEGLPQYLPGQTGASSGFARGFFRQLFAALPTGFCLAVDDYHLLPATSPIHKLLTVAIETLPKGSQLLVMSRQQPRSELVRLLVNQQIALVDGNELLLTEAESARLLKARGIDDPETQADIFARTQGWLAGTVLLLHGSGNGQPVSLCQTEQDQQLLFEYFAAEAFNQCSQPQQQLLQTMALLPQFDALMAASLAGLAEGFAQTELEVLSQQLYFVEKHQQSTGFGYRYHPLFRQFLQAHLAKSIEPNALSFLKTKAAELAASNGQMETAAQLYFELAEWPALIALCVQQSRHLLMSGRSAALLKWIDKIPPEQLRQNPWLLLSQARAMTMEHPGNTSGLYRLAFEGFKEREDSVGVYLSWCGMASDFTMQYGNLTPIDEHLRLFEQLRERHPSYPSPEVQCLVLTFVLWCLNWRWPENFVYPTLEADCEALINKVADPNLRLQLCSALLWHYWVYGKTPFSAQVESLIQQDLAQGQLEPHVDYLVGSVQSVYLAMSGEVEPALAALYRADAVGNQWSVPQRNNMIFTRVFLHLMNNNPDAAAEHLRQLQAGVDQKPLEEALFHLCNAWLSCATGDFQGALPALRMGAALSNELGYRAGEAICEYLSIFAWWKTGEKTKARQALTQLQVLGDAVESTHTTVKISLAASWVAIQDGAADAVIRSHLTRALQCGRQHQVVNYFGKINYVLSPVYSYALYTGIESDYVLSLIQRQKVSPDSLGRTLPEWPWPVRITTLGDFSLVVNGEPRDLSRQSARPAQLLKLLVSRARNPIAVPELIELLWPELDGEKGINNYKVTLSRLRKIIGKDAVLQVDNKVSLSRAHCWVDAWVVQGVIQRAEAEPHWNNTLENLYQRLQALYQGPFLPTDNNFWLIQYRDVIHQAYLGLLAQLANRLLEKGEPQHALAVAEKGLHVDDSHEPIYLAMLRAYGQLNKKSAAVNLFEQYQRVLKMRFSTEPSQAVYRLYQQAIAAG